MPAAAAVLPVATGRRGNPPAREVYSFFDSFFTARNMPFILRCTVTKLGNKLLTILSVNDFLTNRTDPSHGLGSVDTEGAAYIGAIQMSPQ